MFNRSTLNLAETIKMAIVFAFFLAMLLTPVLIYMNHLPQVSTWLFGSNNECQLKWIKK
jgi:multidrug efflux pump subunit AcrB